MQTLKRSDISSNDSLFLPHLNETLSYGYISGRSESLRVQKHSQSFSPLWCGVFGRKDSEIEEKKFINALAYLSVVFRVFRL